MFIIACLSTIKLVSNFKEKDKNEFFVHLCQPVIIESISFFFVFNKSNILYTQETKISILTAEKF